MAQSLRKPLAYVHIFLFFVDENTQAGWAAVRWSNVDA
jgi:hypothetical protein